MSFKNDMIKDFPTTQLDILRTLRTTCLGTLDIPTIQGFLRNQKIEFLSK